MIEITDVSVFALSPIVAPSVEISPSVSLSTSCWPGPLVDDHEAQAEICKDRLPRVIFPGNILEGGVTTLASRNRVNTFHKRLRAKLENVNDKFDVKESYVRIKDNRKLYLVSNLLFNLMGCFFIRYKTKSFRA